MNRENPTNENAQTNSRSTPCRQGTHCGEPGKPTSEQSGPEIACPQPGDLIVVERSEWYALPNGGVLRVCESAGWATPGRDIFVAPRSQVRTFWGPDIGEPDGIKRLHMSSSGGPFKTITLSQVAPLERVGTETDTFWRWQDVPRAGGGVEYQQEVTRWKLAYLPDKGTYLSLEEEERR